mmetsp:Transcript_52064/g.130753  ORF Transcript_52064/g.130753 Transcript_52064/m.130753 type:complete len:142 (+) Transcript_52064:1025-1450(+)
MTPLHASSYHIHKFLLCPLHTSSLFHHIAPILAPPSPPLFRFQHIFALPSPHFFSLLTASHKFIAAVRQTRYANKFPWRDVSLSTLLSCTHPLTTYPPTPPFRPSACRHTHTLCRNTSSLNLFSLKSSHSVPFPPSLTFVR